MSRREKIESMLANDPKDRFLRYSLAMEMRGEQDFAGAAKVFDDLIADKPPHVPAYFMSAQMLAEQGQIESARMRLRDGIDEARRQDDSHAAAEMSELLASLGEYGEL